MTTFSISEKIFSQIKSLMYALRAHINRTHNTITCQVFVGTLIRYASGIRMKVNSRSFTDGNQKK